MNDSPHPPQSLIKYNHPINIKSTQNVETGFTYSVPDTSYNIKGLIEERLDISELLRLMLPSRVWKESDVYFLQEVSPHLTTRDDILRLQTLLEYSLESRQSRTSPICPVREDVMSQAFGIQFIANIKIDELIRQTTIECPERGLFLLRVRDERRMTLECYQTLISLSHELAKHLKSEIPEIERNIIKLKEKKENLIKHVTDLQRKLEILEVKEINKTEEYIINCEKEIIIQQRKNDHLKQILDTNNIDSKETQQVAEEDSKIEEKSSSITEEPSQDN